MHNIGFGSKAAVEIAQSFFRFALECGRAVDHHGQKASMHFVMPLSSHHSSPLSAEAKQAHGGGIFGPDSHASNARQVPRRNAPHRVEARAADPSRSWTIGPSKRLVAPAVIRGRFRYEWPRSRVESPHHTRWPPGRLACRARRSPAEHAASPARPDTQRRTRRAIRIRVEAAAEARSQGC